MTGLSAREIRVDKSALDVVCMGRAAVDLYANEIGKPLPEVKTFSMYVGGCAGNVAIGTARLGLRSAMVTRAGTEGLGEFVVRQLAAEGVDVSGVRRDPARLTGLAILGIQPPDTFPLIFYRENCADIHLGMDDLDPETLRRARVLFVTGTGLSREPSASATRQAARWVRSAGGKVVLDLDHRATLWPGAASDYGEACRELAPRVDLIVGTQEEFQAATGARRPGEPIARMRDVTPAILVQKMGPAGCAVHDGDTVVQSPGFPVTVLNVLGAGDGFASGLLLGWLSGWDWEQTAAFANAVGAIVVTRHGCSIAMPTLGEVEAFMAAHGRKGAALPRSEPAD